MPLLNSLSKTQNYIVKLSYLMLNIPIKWVNQNFITMSNIKWECAAYCAFLYLRSKVLEGETSLKKTQSERVHEWHHRVLEGLAFKTQKESSLHSCSSEDMRTSLIQACQVEGVHPCSGCKSRRIKTKASLHGERLHINTFVFNCTWKSLRQWDPCDPCLSQGRPVCQAPAAVSKQEIKNSPRWITFSVVSLWRDERINDCPKFQFPNMSHDVTFICSFKKHL